MARTDRQQQGILRVQQRDNVLPCIDRGENTVEKIITLWAPKSENPTEAYVRFICTKTGIKRNRPLSIYERRLIVAIIVAMTAFECRRYYPPISYVEAGYDLAVTE